jgi:hypothetical protein
MFYGIYSKILVYPSSSSVTGNFSVFNICSIKPSNVNCDVNIPWLHTYSINDQWKSHLLINIDNVQIATTLLNFYQTMNFTSVYNDSIWFGEKYSCDNWRNYNQCGGGQIVHPVIGKDTAYCDESYKVLCLCLNATIVVTSSEMPSRTPTSLPSRTPSSSPSRTPTVTSPSSSPSRMPTFSPTMKPNTNPTFEPTRYPSVSPSLKPTNSPTISPTLGKPSISPTKKPSNSPTIVGPSSSPTSKPSQKIQQQKVQLRYLQGIQHLYLQGVQRQHRLKVHPQCLQKVHLQDLVKLQQHHHQKVH